MDFPYVVKYVRTFKNGKKKSTFYGYDGTFTIHEDIKFARGYITPTAAFWYITNDIKRLRYEIYIVHSITLEEIPVHDYLYSNIESMKNILNGTTVYDIDSYVHRIIASILYQNIIDIHQGTARLKSNKLLLVNLEDKDELEHEYSYKYSGLLPNVIAIIDDHDEYLELKLKYGDRCQMIEYPELSFVT